MDNNFSVLFAKCPNCGCKERFFEELGKDAIANGTASPEFHFAMEASNGPVIDPKQPLHIGDKPLGFAFETDVCIKCGTVYATKLQRLEVEVKKKPPSIILPGMDGVNINNRNN